MSRIIWYVLKADPSDPSDPSNLTEPSDPSDPHPLSRRRRSPIVRAQRGEIVVPGSSNHTRNANNMLSEYFNDGYDDIFGYIQIAPQIFVPNDPAGGSNTASNNSPSDNDIRITQDSEDIITDYTTTDKSKRVFTANTKSAARAKKVRMSLAQPPGFVEISSTSSRKIVWYYAKNVNNSVIYTEFLRSLEPELNKLLKTHVRDHPIKFNLKLEATYNRPNVPNSSENRTFKTSVVEIFSDSNIEETLERAFIKLLKEEEEYKSRGSGFTLETIDGVVFCKRCFTSFDDRLLKYKLSGQEAFNQHKLICGIHKPILPIMPAEGSILEFEGWGKTQRHTVVIYADFEAILVKTNEKKGKSTTVIQRHEPMSYGIYVKTAENVPIELPEKYDIPTSVIIHRGSEAHTEVAKHFVKTVVDLSRKIEDLLKTNKKIIMSEEQQDEYDNSTSCNLCIRGGLTQASMRYGKANNLKTPEYDTSKPDSWIIYQDYSLIYHINTTDFYADLSANSNLLDRMDTANLLRDHSCYISDRKKHPGYFSDEVDGNVITEFCALRAKSYAFNIYTRPEENKVGGEKIKAKGIRAHVVKNHMTLEDHKKYLFGEVGMEVYKKNVSIRSFNHQPVTIRTKKLTYNSYDDKRVLDDKIHNLAHGHYNLEEDDDEQTVEWADHEIDAGGTEWSESDKDLMRLLLREYMSK
ncbi:hypothetical protein QTP88_001704 [Uroleucon formosanum]